MCVVYAFLQLFRCFVICFEYVNAVWYLEYEVFPYVCGNQAILDSVYCKSFITYTSIWPCLSFQKLFLNNVYCIILAQIKIFLINTIITYMCLITTVASTCILCSGSHSYLLATRDVQFFFPNGLCCIQNGFTESNKVLTVLRR